MATWHWTKRLIIAGVSADAIRYPGTGVPRRYNVGPFDATINFRRDGAESSINTGETIRRAWDYILTRSATCADCNAYFRSLRNHQSLTQLLDAGDIVIAALVPAAGRSDADVPRGWNNDARVVAVNVLDVIAGATDRTALAATILHELAHIAGASTNAHAPQPEASEAETALKHCLLTPQFDPNALGVLLNRDPLLPQSGLV